MNPKNVYFSNRLWALSSFGPLCLCAFLIFCVLLPSVSHAQASGNAPATLALPIQNASNIQWYKDGTAISGANATTYSATTGGIYYAKYDDPAACAGRSTTTINLTVIPTADLSITATPLTLTSNKGEIQQYVITVTNNGPDTAPNATARIPIPNGRTFLTAVPSQGSYDAGTQIWTVGSLANGASATMTWSIKIN